jgi:hypothetical protein
VRTGVSYEAFDLYLHFILFFRARLGQAYSTGAGEGHGVENGDAGWDCSGLVVEAIRSIIPTFEDRSADDMFSDGNLFKVSPPFYMRQTAAVQKPYFLAFEPIPFSFLYHGDVVQQATHVGLIDVSSNVLLHAIDQEDYPVPENDESGVVVTDLDQHFEWCNGLENYLSYIRYLDLMEARRISNE